MFSLRNKKDISIFRMKKVPYLLLCTRVCAVPCVSVSSGHNQTVNVHINVSIIFWSTALNSYILDVDFSTCMI